VIYTLSCIEIIINIISQDIVRKKKNDWSNENGMTMDYHQKSKNNKKT
jgi:hypothetical protein